MFAKTLATIVNGGVTDMFSNGSRFDMDSYYLRIYAKTASLFELATAAAAKLANASQEISQAAGQFGSAFGMAFQIIKDVADFNDRVEGDNSLLGANMRQGVISLPVLYYSKTHPDDPDLIVLQSKNGHRNGNLDRLIQSVRQSAALTQSQDKAQSYTKKALAALNTFPVSPKRVDLEAFVQEVLTMKVQPV